MCIFYFFKDWRVAFILRQIGLIRVIRLGLCLSRITLFSPICRIFPIRLQPFEVLIQSLSDRAETELLGVDIVFTEP